MSDGSAGSAPATPVSVGRLCPRQKKPLTRHMYSNEQQRFVWYHRKVLKMTAKKTHQIFHEHFNPEVKVSVDGINQLAGRMRRTQPPEVVSVVHNEPWAFSVARAPSEEVSHSLPQLSASSANNVWCMQAPNSPCGVSHGVSHGLSGGTRSGSEPREESTTADLLGSPSSEPADSSLRHRRRHIYTNEEQRFVWFYRYVLLMDSLQTYKMFQKYFNVPGLKRGTLKQLAARLHLQQREEVVKARNTEPWAVGRVPGVVS